MVVEPNARISIAQNSSTLKETRAEIGEQALRSWGYENPAAMVPAPKVPATIVAVKYPALPAVAPEGEVEKVGLPALHLTHPEAP
jgi:hypothetical protein